MHDLKRRLYKETVVKIWTSRLFWGKAGQEVMHPQTDLGHPGGAKSHLTQVADKELTSDSRFKGSLRMRRCNFAAKDQDSAESFKNSFLHHVAESCAII